VRKYCSDSVSTFTSVNDRTAALSFAVNDLGVRHVVVMGHYGCGGIAAALMPPAAGTFVVDPVQRWIQPIRELYRTSMRFFILLSSSVQLIYLDL
jgi:carbonic anhydrase